MEKGLVLYNLGWDNNHGSIVNLFNNTETMKKIGEKY